MKTSHLFRVKLRFSYREPGDIIRPRLNLGRKLSSCEPGDPVRARFGLGRTLLVFWGVKLRLSYREPGDIIRARLGLPRTLLQTFRVTFPAVPTDRKEPTDQLRPTDRPTDQLTVRARLKF